MRLNPNRFALRPTLIYAAMAAAWIALSDWLVLALVRSPEEIGRYSMVKGWVFVAVTSLLLYELIRRSLVRQRRHLESKAKVEVELRQWADAFANCAHGIALGEPATNRIFACNPAFATMHGYPAPEMAGTSFLDLYAPEDREKARAAAEEADRSGRVQFEGARRRRDGSVFPAQMDVVSVRGKRGEILYRVTTMQDITQRKQAEAALRESEERFRAVVENIQEVFWVSEPRTGRITYVSPAYEAIWGRSSAEMLGRTSDAWLAIIHGEDRERMAAAALHQAENGYDEQYRALRPDGTIRWVRDQAFPVRDPEGKVMRVVGVAQDITERKQLEAQFLRAQRMEAIGTLAGGVAHDLNNILAPMLMAAGLLKEKITDEHDRDMLSMVERSARRGADIIRQLLTFSRGVEGSRVPLQARHLIKEVATIARETFPRQITLVEDAPVDLWPVVADATQLHQVLVNLCVNARDAMPNGGTLTLDARNRELSAADPVLPRNVAAGPFVIVTVRDTGVGIAPEIVDRIFDPFFTTKDPGKGTGLGLSTVLGIVRSHGGFITVQSTVGRGSAFDVYLPAAPAEVDHPEADRTEPLPLGGGETILVVDDEEAIRDATRHVLEKQNYRVLTAGDGKEAVGAFLNHRQSIRLVLTDVMMPEMGGAALVRALRLVNPELKFVATSGLETETQHAEFSRLGISEILPKPCSSKMLVETIHRTLSEADTAAREQRARDVTV